MEPRELLAALLALAEEVALPVRRIGSDASFEGLAPTRSGVCVVRGRCSVWLSPADPAACQVEALARALRAHAGAALEMRFLPPAIRACLERDA
jgi:hypothetical protein